MLLALASQAGASPVDCAALSGETIRWLVPSRPGGGYDAYSRLMQPFIEERLGVRVFIENRSEAGGIVAAITLRDAPPDGKTLGLVNASGLLAAGTAPNGNVPDPVTDFAILGRVVSNRMVVFTSRESAFQEIGELLAASRERPMLVGVRDVGSASFFAVPVVASLLNMDYALVSGYVGSATRVLALIRGEIDIVFHHFDSAQRYVQAGELLPLLQITEDSSQNSAAIDEELAGVPVLAGPDGLARQRSAASGRSPAEAERAAAALAAIVGAGRLVVGPAGLSGPLKSCLSSALGDVLTSEALLAAAAKASLGIAYLEAAEAHRRLLTARRELPQFERLVREAIEQARR